MGLSQMEVVDQWRSGFRGFRSLGFADEFRIWDLDLVIQIYDLVVSDLKSFLKEYRTQSQCLSMIELRIKNCLYEEKI